MSGATTRLEAGRVTLEYKDPWFAMTAAMHMSITSDKVSKLVDDSQLQPTVE